MNPYVSFGLAMCGVVGLAFAGTAYMAIYFNRKAKADMLAALQPLADVVDGELDLDEAKISGRFAGHIAEGQIALLPGGMGRVFHSQLIDGAGGDRWSLTVSRSKDGVDPPTIAVDPVGAELGDRIDSIVQQLIGEPSLAGIWFRADYDPVVGSVRLTRPMMTRRDFPRALDFEHWLETLRDLADANRQLQSGP